MYQVGLWISWLDFFFFYLSGPFGRDSSASGPDLASHFSVSLDYGPESPLNVDQISFNSLKERVELVLTGGEEGRQSSFGSTISPTSTEITGSGRQYGVSVTSQTSNNISFEEAVVQASKEVRWTIMHVLVCIVMVPWSDWLGVWWIKLDWHSFSSKVFISY